MLRLVACLVALSGCARVWGLDEENLDPPACGPYIDETPVVFPDDLPDAANFNLAKGRRGVLYRGSVVSAMTTVVLESSDGITWTHSPDPGEAFSVGTTLIGRLVASNDMYLADINDQSVALYTFVKPTGSESGWTPQSPLAFNMHGAVVGNAVRTVDHDGVEQFRRLVLTVLDDNDKRTIQMTQKSGDPAADWSVNSLRTNPLNTDKTLVDLGQAVMTEDMNTLVYAAKYRDDTAFGLFVSVIDNANSFEKGLRIEIDGVAPDDDLLEPSISSDCKVIYYRRQGQTFTAHAK